MGQRPTDIYQQLINDGLLNPDTNQAITVQRLDDLYTVITSIEEPSLFSKIFGGSQQADPNPDHSLGLYIYGGVGRGKSTLMDMFYDTLPIQKKRRVHFHEFMLEIHGTLHKRRQSSGDKSDPLPKIADDISEQYTVLCFDEFHITNITDAMILGRLFSTLFANGTFVVSTSNWAPDDLYKDGLQRENFLPFIALLKDTLDIIHLDSPTDFRLIHMDNIEVFHSPLGAETTQRLGDIFKTLTAGTTPAPVSIDVNGRELPIERAAIGVGLTTFDNLCGSARGAEDYLTLAHHFKTIIIDGVPVMDESLRNEAKRFMTMIDALYENNVNLIMGCDDEPAKLYCKGTHAFEFERTISRLIEMQSKQYQQQKSV